MTANRPALENIGPYSFLYGPGQPITTDTLLLVDFVLQGLSDERGAVMDLGTGSGAIPLMLAAGSAVKDIVGVEIMSGPFKEAEANVRRNGLSSRIKILQMDYRGLPQEYEEGSYTHVVCNPPYLRAGAARVSPEEERAAARTEIYGGLAEILSVSRHLAGSSGGLYMVFPVRRLTELIIELERAGLRPVRIKFVHSGRKKECKIFLVEARKSGPLRVEEPVFL
ncbi:MAG: tRNA1(Val) (adenine(37)-N6)-methyltransferase [Thermodesulfobacteriota bacterium]